MRMLSKLGMMGALAMAIAGGASAGTLYKWTNADGVVSYSDELKRIPEAFRASAQRVQTGSLVGYKRFTPVQPSPAPDYPERLEERVDRLRELNEQHAAAAQADAAKRVSGFPSAAVRVNRNIAIGLPAEQIVGDAPIVVEEQRVRTGDSTTHIYVVRQGDRVLSVIRPHTNHSGSDWPTEEELLGED